MTKVTKDSVWFSGRMVAKKKLGKDLFGVLCVCGKKHRFTTSQLHSDTFPCSCKSKPINALVSGTQVRSDKPLLVELIPYAEDEYRSNPKERNAYAMNSLISQARELVADIQAERDSKGLALRLSHEILSPAFVSMAQNVIDTIYYLKRTIDPNILPDEQRRVYKHMDEAARSIASYMEMTYNETRDRIIETMSE